MRASNGSTAFRAAPWARPSVAAIAHLAAMLMLLANTAHANMRAPAFGKLRWGQDASKVFITAFVPGVDVTDNDKEFVFNNSHFRFAAHNPANGERYSLDFEFREDVNASAAVMRHSTWKYGNPNNSLFAIIPKLEPDHLFDRLYAQKPNKQLKFAIEKDWDRYTVSDDMLADDDEEEDDDEDSDSDEDADIVKLTDATFESKTAAKSLTVFRVYFPWCGSCKKHDDFTKAATSKRGRKLKKKYGIMFGSVDAREQSMIRRNVSAVCKGPEADKQADKCTSYLYTKLPDLPAQPWPSELDFSLANLLKMTGPNPRPLTTFAQVQSLQRDSKDKTLVLGMFDRSQHPEAVEAYLKVSSERRNEFLFGMMEESKLVGSTIQEMIAKFTGPQECLQAPIQAPAILLLKNFSSDQLDDGWAAFGQHEATTRPSITHDGEEFADTRVKDRFDSGEISKFIDVHSQSELLREKAETPQVVDGSPTGRTVVRMFVSDAQEAKQAMSTFRCTRQLLHREARFVYHDERHETGKPVVGSNMSEATTRALLDFGMAGASRPLVAVSVQQVDGTTLHYGIKIASSAKYLAKQIRRAVSGEVGPAVRSGASPDTGAALSPGKIGVLVGSTLAPAVEMAGEILFEIYSGKKSHLLSTIEGDKAAKALVEVGSDIRMASMDASANDCNFSDSRLPANLREVTNGCREGVVFISKSAGAVSYGAVNFMASPLLQFLNDNSATKFDVAKAQEHVRWLDSQCAVTAHQHGARNGKSTVFRVGEYTLEQMTAAGAANDDVSSLTVAAGCQATLYENGDFSGWNATFEPGMYDVAALQRAGAKNDEASSLVVSVFVPPKPPVQSGKPGVEVAANGDMHISWQYDPLQEGVAKTDSYQVFSVMVKDAQGAETPGLQPQLRSTTLLALTEAANQTHTIKHPDTRFEAGAEYVFQIKPFSQKYGMGEFSERSEPVVAPMDRPRVEKDEV